jgi:hypothetical protein
MARQQFAITSIPYIICLDGHARGVALDVVWHDVFQTKTIPVKQLTVSNSHNNTQSRDSIEDAIVVNSISAIGDEGYESYAWRKRTNHMVQCRLDHENTLVDFHDFHTGSLRKHPKKTTSNGGCAYSPTILDVVGGQGLRLTPSIHPMGEPTRPSCI